MVKARKKIYINSNQTIKSEDNHHVIPDMKITSQKDLYVVNNNQVNVYNSTGGGLIDVFEGHNHKIISICQTSILNEEVYITCDVKGNLNFWYSDKKHPRHGSSDSINLGKDSSVTHFSATKDYFILAYTTNKSSQANLCTLQKLNLNAAKFKLTNSVMIGQNKVTSSGVCPVVAAIKEKELFVVDVSMVNKKQTQTRNHLLGDYRLNCIAFHPTKEIIATGNMNGSIFLWYEIMNKYPAKVNLHWHTMPVNDLCFTSTGTDLFSGGKECTLVKWQLTNDNRPTFLPRMGSPIQCIQTDETNSTVAVMEEDRSVVIVNSKEMKLEGLIQSLPLHIPCPDESLFAIGLHYHSISGSLIRNGRTGYIVFFHPEPLKIDCNMDISLTNFVTEERSKKLPNFQVTKASISTDGAWLVTCEACHLTKNLKEILMKFWYFSSDNQRWELNTVVERPHSDAINSLCLSLCEDEDNYCLSCSEEGKFKLWKLSTYTDVLGKEKRYWNLKASREFRSLPATASSFAPDGSLFSVAFANVVTLWNPVDVTMKGVLTQPFLRERIVDMSFSHGDWEGSALVTRSDNYLCTWNLLSCSLMWRVCIKSTCLAVDPVSGLMALFSKDKDVYFFEPRFKEPISSEGEISSEEVVCAVFAPCHESSALNYSNKVSNKRKLYYFDSEQTFRSLVLPGTSNKDSRKGEIDGSSDGVIEVSPNQEDSEEVSQQHNAIVAKTKKTNSRTDLPSDLNVTLSAPSINKLIKEIHDLRVHSLSLFGLVEHVESFLPDLKPVEDSKIKSKIPAYNVVTEEQRSINSKDQNRFILDEDKNLSSIKSLNYNNLIDKLYS